MPDSDPPADAVLYFTDLCSVDLGSANERDQGRRVGTERPNVGVAVSSVRGTLSQFYFYGKVRVRSRAGQTYLSCTLSDGSFVYQCYRRVGFIHVGANFVHGIPVRRTYSFTQTNLLVRMKQQRKMDTP
jgi:hypothetical protein